MCASEASDNRMSEAPGTGGDFGGRKGFLTNKANLEAGKSAASVAAGATCRAAGGRRLQKTNPFGEAWRTERPEDRETGVRTDFLLPGASSVRVACPA